MVEGVFSLLFYCESGINWYVGQETLVDVFLSWDLFAYCYSFENASSRFYVKRKSRWNNFIMSLVLCSIKYMKKRTFLNITWKRW